MQEINRIVFILYTMLIYYHTKKMTTTGQNTSPINYIDQFSHQTTNTETFLQVSKIKYIF